MSNIAIIGLGFGDEGKGTVTEYLCSQDPENTSVVRFSGGQQAAHKVIKGDIEHTFHHLGSGTLSGCSTYWSEYCTFNPWTLWNEYLKLSAKDVEPKLYIHPDCAVTTFYDMYPEPDSPEMKHGTCGHGIFRTKQRHATVPITVLDLMTNEPEQLDFLERQVRKFYSAEPLDQGRYWDAVFDIRSLLFKNFTITDKPPYAKHLVFEGSQGLMLDEHIGTMPHCTPSDITPRNAMKMADLDEVFLVTRCYQTRHGNGPMTNEDLSVELVNTEKETCVDNEYQGKLRTSVLDLDQLIHAKREGIDKVVPYDTKISLVITCMDQMSTYFLSRRNDLYPDGKQILTFDKALAFANFISEALGIDGRPYVNFSPHSFLSRRMVCTSKK